MAETVVTFKKGIDPNNFKYLHPDLRYIFEWLAFTMDRMGYTIEITSMIRPHFADTGIHAKGRALDCVPRTKNGKRSPGFAIGQKIVSFMSLVWRRPSTFPVAIWHDSGSGWHFHIQVDATYNFVPDKANLPAWEDLNGAVPKEQCPTSEQNY